jgi:hypothetical protein
MKIKDEVNSITNIYERHLTLVRYSFVRFLPH